MLSDKRFLDINFYHILNEIIVSLKMDLEDMITFFEEKKCVIGSTSIDGWKKNTLPEGEQFKILIEYIKAKTNIFNDIEGLHLIEMRLKEYIKNATLIPIRDREKLIKTKEPGEFFMVIMNYAYDYQKYNNTTQMQLSNFIDFIYQKERYQPKVFISYSWDSSKHKKIVSFLVGLLKESRINVHYDGDSQFAQDINRFAYKITICDYVLVICTPEYKEKADKRLGWVGVETDIMIKDLDETESEIKFIPVLFTGECETSYPSWIKNKVGVDLRSFATAVTSAKKGVDLHTLTNEFEELKKLIKKLSASTLLG